MPRKGYYLWDWHRTRQIAYDPNITFHSQEYAITQSAFKSFQDCKRHGIEELKEQIYELQQDLKQLRSLTLQKWALENEINR